ERERRQVAEIDALVADLLQEPEALARFFPQISSGEHRMAVPFGSAIAQQAPDATVWRAPIVDAYERTAPDERNFGLLVGYFFGLADHCPAMVAEFKKEGAVSASLAPALPYLCLRL